MIGSFQLVDRFLFPSKFIRDYYVENLPIPVEKTAIIPTFVDTSQNVNMKIKEKNYFLFVGQLTEEKGILPLLDVFSSLPLLQLIVVGDGPLRRKVGQYRKYKNIIIKHFLPREKVYAYMKHAVATIIPSLWYDVLPNVMLESFSQGTPVVVPRTGVFTDLVQENESGFFYEQKNKNNLKRVLEKICSREKDVKTMKEIYKERYSSEIHFRNLMSLYSILLK